MRSGTTYLPVSRAWRSTPGSDPEVSENYHWHSLSSIRCARF